MLSSRIRAALLALAFPALFLYLHAHTLSWQGDPDRYYHFAVSRFLNEQHAFHLQTLPQVENLDWDRYYPDKEFLFHVLTKAGDALGGRRGVELAALAASAGTAVTLFWFALAYLPLLEAFACAFAASFSPVVIRMLLVRPHVLAIFLFVLMAAAIARRRPALAAAAALAYCLSYHAFYIPLFGGLLAIALALREERSTRGALLRLGALVLGGVAVGLIVNPYFPSNVLMALAHARIPFLLQGALRSASFGLELYPLSGPGVLKFFYLPFLIVLGALAAGLFRDFTSRFLLILSLVLAVLSFKTLRAGEYLLPVAGLLLPVLVARLPARRWIFGVAALQLLMVVYVARTEASFVPDGELYESVRAAIARIPTGEAKVFNCEWDTSPLLLDARPDLRFVDILDPSLLFDADPGRFRARDELIAGAVTDVRAMVSSVFSAGYVLCRAPKLVDQLDADPSFRRLYPRAGEAGKVSLFAVAPGPSPAFVRRFQFHDLDAAETLRARAFVPHSAGLISYDVPESLVVMGLRDARGTGLRCAQVSADPSGIVAHKGAAYLGIGGGGAIRAWRNGKLLFASGPEYPRARSVQALVRLEPPLREKDRIDLLVCSGPASRYWTAALSLWAESDVREICRAKAAAIGGPVHPASAETFSTDRDTCLGPLAGPAVPGELRP